MRNFLRHLSSFIAPVLMSILLPYWIIAYENRAGDQPWVTPSLWQRILGGLVLVVGLAIFFLTVRMFILIGRGTIMPWDPTRRLIIGSLYAHVRNPMILSVLLIQIGVALFFASPGVALLAGFFFVLNTLYFKISEEPGLVKRFGEEYLEYRKNVPMWIPRIKPWRPTV